MTFVFLAALLLLLQGCATPTRLAAVPAQDTTRAQGLGDLYRIYSTAQRDGLDYNLAYISADFTTPRKEDFDNEYMRALFDYGYQLGRKGYPWHKTPPG